MIHSSVSCEVKFDRLLTNAMMSRLTVESDENLSCTPESGGKMFIIQVARDSGPKRRMKADSESDLDWRALSRTKCGFTGPCPYKHRVCHNHSHAQNQPTSQIRYNLCCLSQNTPPMCHPRLGEYVCERGQLHVSLIRQNHSACTQSVDWTADVA
jgi:hypothetical protein